MKKYLVLSADVSELAKGLDFLMLLICPLRIVILCAICAGETRV